MGKSSHRNVRPPLKLNPSSGRDTTPSVSLKARVTRTGGRKPAKR